MVAQLYPELAKSKKKNNAKTISELAKQTNNIIDIFSLKHLEVIKVLNYAKEFLNNVNKHIRNAGSDIFKKIY